MPFHTIAPRGKICKTTVQCHCQAMSMVTTMQIHPANTPPVSFLPLAFLLVLLMFTALQFVHKLILGSLLCAGWDLH